MDFPWSLAEKNVAQLVLGPGLAVAGLVVEPVNELELGLDVQLLNTYVIFSDAVATGRTLTGP